MNRTYYTLIIFLLAFQLNGQDEGQNNLNKFIGGQFSISNQDGAYPLSAISFSPILGGTSILYSNASDISTFSTSFSPYYGIQLNDQWSIGGNINIGYQKYSNGNITVIGTTEPTTLTRKSTVYGLGVFARYALTHNPRANFFIQPFAEYTRIDETEEVENLSSAERNVWFLETGVSLGLLYNINDRFRLTGQFGGLNAVFGKTSTDQSMDSESFSSIGANLRLSSFAFGVEVRI